MSKNLIEKIYALFIFIIFLMIVFHAPLTVISTQLFGNGALFFKAWKEILMFLTIPLAIIVIHKHNLIEVLKKSFIFWLVITYVVIHMIVVVFNFQGLLPTAAGILIDLRYVLFFAIVYIFLIAFPHYRNLFIKAAIIGMLIVVYFATMQLFLPRDVLALIGYDKTTIIPYLLVDDNDSFVRVNSTLRGPNPLGAYAVIVIGVIGSIAVKHVKIFKKNNGILTTTIFIASLITLWISYSRSALFAGIVVILILVLYQYRKNVFTIKGAALGTMLILVCLTVVFALRSTPLISNVLLHDNPGNGNGALTNYDHLESVMNGISRVGVQPFGYGVGSTGSASLLGNSSLIIENQYLFIAHEIGVVGLIVFSTLNFVLIIELWKRRESWLSLAVFASGIGLFLIGILLPVWVDDTVSITWWGLAAMALSTDRKNIIEKQT